MHAVHPGHVAESAVVPGGSAEVAVLGGGCDSGWKQDGNIWEYMGICIYICTVYIYIPIGSMYAIYGLPWIPSIYPLYVSIPAPAGSVMGFMSMFHPISDDQR